MEVVTKEQATEILRNMEPWRWNQLLDVLFSAARRQGLIDEQGRPVKTPAPAEGGAQCQAG